MIRLTTPQHQFTFPDDPSEYKRILITYSQGDKIILEKTEEDMIFEDMTGRLSLSQEETSLFSPNGKVRIQVRVLTDGDTALASDIFTINVSDVLNGEVLI